MFVFVTDVTFHCFVVSVLPSLDQTMKMVGFWNQAGSNEYVCRALPNKKKCLTLNLCTVCNVL